MADITEISAIVAAAGVLVGVVYYFLQMRYQTKLMRSDALVRLYTTTNNKEILNAYWKLSGLQAKNYEDYKKQYGSIHSENPIHEALMKVLGVYDLVGSLLYNGLIDLDLVYIVVGIDSTKTLHDRLQPLLLGIRNETNEPGAYAGFDYLVGELVKRQKHLKKATARMLEKSRTA